MAVEKEVATRPVQAIGGLDPAEVAEREHSLVIRGRVMRRLASAGVGSGDTR